MTHPCTIRAFSGCACLPGECQSYAARAEKITAAERTVMAKQTAYPALAIFTFGLLVAVAVFGGLTLNNHFARQALIDQENVHVARH